MKSIHDGDRFRVKLEGKTKAEAGVSELVAIEDLEADIKTIVIREVKEEPVKKEDKGKKT